MQRGNVPAPSFVEEFEIEYNLKRKVKRNLSTFLALLVFIALGCNGQTEVQNAQNENESKARNVILLIGDGMGLTQVSVRFVEDGETTNFSRFSHIGLFSNQPVGEKITDSAAGATAFASGVQTYNGAIGVDADTAEVETLVEILSRKGKSAGVLATSTITHATPACFYAHVPSRQQHEDIARYLVYSEVDYFAGGGSAFLGNRRDGINYIDTLRAKGFNIDLPMEPESTYSPDAPYGRLVSATDPASLNDGRVPFLLEDTERAIQHLNQTDEGFFLMIEGSQIDWGGHENNFEYVTSEMEEFDNVIGAALDFAERDGNTLVVVTADHETGGLALTGRAPANPEDEMNSSYSTVGGAFSTGGHTAALIPVFAFGPGADNFSGVYKNTDIFNKILESVE